jgi:aminoglycoside phosphotransferase (APT) family kinase protein
MEIPDSADAITAEWLSDAVQRACPDARASRVAVVDAHSGTTGRARLVVEWQRGDLPRAVFAKLAPTDPIQRAMVVKTGMGAREARFYHELGRSLPVRVPRPICSQWAADGSAYIMLGEDLSSSGCRFPDFGTGADLAIVRSAVEGLARLHAAFWESPRFEQDLAWIKPPRHNKTGPLMIAEGVRRFGAEQPEVFHEMARIYLEHGAAFAELLGEGPRTLAHGDPHLGNLFVDGATVGFLDWACVFRAPGLRDVAYVLSNSVDTELRRAEQEGLVRRYLAVLTECGVEAPGFDDAWRAYRRFVASGWIAAVATYAAGDRMQSLEVGRRAVARTNAVLEDLGTVELLRADLGL